MTKISDLEKRVNRLGEGQELSLTTEEANAVRWFWIRLHWTDEEAKEYSDAETRQEEISAAAGSPYLNAEENREYMDLTKRQTELAHDIGMKRVIDNDTLRDEVWPELAPRVLRFYKLTEKPSEQRTSEETKELQTLLDWFTELQRKVLRTSGVESSKLRVDD